MFQKRGLNAIERAETVRRRQEMREGVSFLGGWSVFQT